MCTFLRESRNRGIRPIVELRRATGDIEPHDKYRQA
jgi:hypothetical protein